MSLTPKVATWCPPTSKQTLLSTGVSDCIYYSFYLAYIITECGPEWEPRKQSCYHLYEVSDNTVLKNWTAARDYCISQGGHLLQLETREELDFINDRFSQNITNIGTRLLQNPVNGSLDVAAWTALNDIDQGLYHTPYYQLRITRVTPMGFLACS